MSRNKKLIITGMFTGEFHRAKINKKKVFENAKHKLLSATGPGSPEQPGERSKRNCCNRYQHHQQQKCI